MITHRFLILALVPALLSLNGFSAVAAPKESRLPRRHFVFPEMGLGYGHAFLTQNASQPIAQLDFQVGTEWDWGKPRASAGWLLNLGYATSVLKNPVKKFHRFHIAPLASLSAGYGWWTSFARASAGPQLSVTHRDEVIAVGGGLALDGAIGFKNAVELYSQAMLTVDPIGPSFTFMAGFRVNVIVFLGTLHIWSHLSEEEPPPYYYEPHTHERPRHDASPLRPGAGKGRHNAAPAR